MKHHLDDEFELMNLAELESYAADHVALAARAKDHIKQWKLKERQSLANFMLANHGMFLLFFRLGGCKRPEEAIESLTEHPEQYRPMAYAQKEEL